MISIKDLMAQISIALDAVEAELKGAVKYHGKRVALLSMEIGKKLGYKEERLFFLGSAALLHDNALTEYILSEREGTNKDLSVRMHCMKGEDNVKALPFYSQMEGFVRYHHERPDGGGAFGLKEGEYPVEAGIIELGDQVDVMFHLGDSSGQKYTAVMEHIQAEKGKKYETAIADAASEVLREEFLSLLAPEKVSQSLLDIMPEYDRELSEAEIVRLSGIFAKIIDYKSKFTKEHSMQIANKAWYMSGVYGYENHRKAQLYLAASLHDIGKLFIPVSILEKPGALNEEEFSIIKTHCEYSWEVLRGVRGFEQIAGWAANHHEKLNGKGYPYQLTAEQLDFNSRLMACLDVYQAVREKRPYHGLRTHEETMSILFGMADQEFLDRQICEDFNIHMAKLENGYADYPEIL